MHRTLHDVLGNKVIVDRRVGRNSEGVYQEPIERVLEYMGLTRNAAPDKQPFNVTDRESSNPINGVHFWWEKSLATP